MKIRNGELEIEIYADELRHFKIDTPEQVQSFINTVVPPTAKGEAIGFILESEEEDESE